MSNSVQSEYFPIRVLAEKTGVGTSTLRAWERRYGLLQPRRTPKGHRLYTEQDVRLVERVLELLGDGHAVGEVARRIAGQAEPNPPQPAAAEGDAPRAEGVWADYLDRLLRSVEAFSPQRLDAVYNDASSLYPLDLVSERLIEPALAELGGRWTGQAIGIAEEHFFTAWLRNKLGARLHHAAALGDGSTLVLACVPGHQHEIGLLLFALAALSRGYRVVYLGIDMPLEPLPEVVRRCGAKGLVLAVGRTSPTPESLAAMTALVARLDGPLFIGGPLQAAEKEALDRGGAIPVGEQFALALHAVAAKVAPRRTAAARGAA